MVDQVLLLNRNNSSPLYSKLKRSIDESKQGKAVAPQWASMIKAMTQKGVKSMEIEESSVLAWLEAQDPTKPITREELSTKLDSLMFTVKEVCLERPKFSGHRQAGGTYREYLYIANSERDNVIDELEKVEYEMNELVFTPERIIDEPELVINLDRQRSALIELKGKSIDFAQHHFSGDTTGRHGKNLLAHCRVTERPEFGLYFIDEIQSDWAQRGRKSDWNGIPKGPLVTNTEAWAGMVLRRHLQMAAMNPRIQNVAWITESMRNGGSQNLSSEMSKLAAKQAYDQAIKEGMAASLELIGANNLVGDALVEAKRVARIAVVADVNNRGIREPYDMLNDFYLKVIPKIVDKAIAGTGEKVEIKEIKIAEGVTIKVPTVALTDAVRAKLCDKQPLYSRAMLLKNPRPTNDPVLESLVRNAKEMLGSVKNFRLVNTLYDIATGNRVAGRYVNKMIQVSLSSRNIEEVCDHECFHFAEDNLFTQKEIRTVHASFALGTKLNEDVREILTARGDYVLAKECMQPSEAAAQGFALWKSGLLEVQDEPVKGIFSDLINAVKDVGRWIRREVLAESYTTPEEIFAAFASGDIAKRKEADKEYYAPVYSAS